MLPEVVASPLVEKFGKFSLCNQVADFEIGSNSNSTLPWIVACEPSPEPSCETTPLHEHFPYGLCNSVGPTRKLSPHVGPARRSPPSTPRTPIPYPATTRTLPTSSTSARTQSSPSPSSTQLRNRYQVLPLAWSSHPLPPVDSSIVLTASPQT
jgi:hypothetical protein